MMKSLESFLLLCGVHTAILSLLLLIAALTIRFCFGRRASSLVATGLWSLIALWVVALIPMNGWFGSEYLRFSKDTFATSANDLSGELPSTAISDAGPSIESSGFDNNEKLSPTNYLNELLLATRQQLSQSPPGRTSQWSCRWLEFRFCSSDTIRWSLGFHQTLCRPRFTLETAGTEQAFGRARASKANRISVYPDGVFGTDRSLRIPGDACGIHGWMVHPQDLSVERLASVEGHGVGRGHCPRGRTHSKR